MSNNSETLCIVCTNVWIKVILLKNLSIVKFYTISLQDVIREIHKHESVEKFCMPKGPFFAIFLA